jgi:glucose-6-phosphate isomerase
VGGRYSVFSAVGIVPLTLLGLDVSALHEGARAAIQASLRPHRNPALELAAALAEHYARGVRVHDFFAFHSELETLGKWHRQLLAESVGKTREHDHERIGFHASVVIGSTDLHSVGQLIFGGPRNRFATFVTVPSLWRDETPIPADGPFAAEALTGNAVGAIPRAIFEGTARAYSAQGLPYASIELADCTERELGACMGLSMVSVMLLGKFLGVNVFDQPAVELYKQETLAVLGAQRV